jgi:hypothetical protein
MNSGKTEVLLVKFNQELLRTSKLYVLEARKEAGLKRSCRGPFSLVSCQLLLPTQLVS